MNVSIAMAKAAVLFPPGSVYVWVVPFTVISKVSPATVLPAPVSTMVSEIGSAP